MVDLALWATACLTIRTILIIVTDEDCGSLCQWLPDHQNHPHLCDANFVQLQSIDNLQIDYRLQKQMLCYNITIKGVFYLHPGFHLGPPLSHQQLLQKADICHWNPPGFVTRPTGIVNGTQFISKFGNL